MSFGFPPPSQLEAARKVWDRKESIDLYESDFLELPYVNRVPALEAAAVALVQNLRAADNPRADSRQFQLVVGAQLFGTGKTSFARRLSAGLAAGFRNRMFSRQ